MTDLVLASSEQYETYAQHCLSLAARMADRDSRVILREMAAEWLNLTLDRPNASTAPHGTQPGS
jgi:hypothetical protein